ncbi:MAG: phage tail sheath subtilisin-like domain-containing protein [Pseudomonadota bacterium]
MDFLHGIEVIEVSDGIRAIATPRSSIIGLIGTAPTADVAAFPLNTPVLVFGPRQMEAIGTTGTLRDAYAAIYSQGVNLAVVIRVDEGVDDAATQANIVGDAIAGTGVWAFLAAESVLRVTPRILAAPAFTSNRPGGAANPVVAAMIPIAERMRAVVVADGPNTTTPEAVTYIDDFDSDRLYVVDPFVRIYDPTALEAAGAANLAATGGVAGGVGSALLTGDITGATAAIVTRPASAYVAGRISRTDLDRGFWWSPSNQVIDGIVGTARPIGFSLSDPQAESNILNEGNVATIVHRDGYRLWGNRTNATDPNWSFLSVRRTADLIYDAIEQGHLWAMDRPISGQLIIDIRDGVQAYIDNLVALGALLGGRVWFDPELNSQTQLQQGKLTLDFDIEPPAPLERLTFRAHRNGAYYETLALEVAATSTLT